MSSPPAQTKNLLAELQSSPIENFLATVLVPGQVLMPRDDRLHYCRLRY